MNGARWYERVRYEDGPWPLWRVDKNVAYVTKSLVHRVAPWTDAERDAHVAARRQLERGQWRRDLSDRWTLCLGGDLMWIRDGWEEHLSEALQEIVARADLAVANLETPVDPDRRVPKWTYETLHYNAPAEYLRPWSKARRTVMSLCNNHALDQGEGGLARTRARVVESGIRAVGGPSAEDAVEVVQVRGARVAVTAATYGVNHLRGAPPKGIPVLQFGSDVRETDWSAVAELIARARATSPDLVVLAAHWGFEYECWPGAKQREAARRLFELGVDVIVGSSPHVLQPVELASIDGIDPDCPLQVTRGSSPRYGLVAWSLGNLSTIMPTVRCQTGALVEVTLGRTPQGALSVCDLRAHATHSARGNGRSVLGARTLDVEALRRRGGDAARVTWIATEALGATLLEETP